MKVWPPRELPTRSLGVNELSAIYIEHRSVLVARAARTLRDRSRAEEVIQDALVKLILAAPELRNGDHALAYLSRTVDSLCVDIFRREGRRPSLVVLDDRIDGLEEALQDRRDLSDIVSAAEDAAIVRNALSLLSPAERAALVMWEIEGRSTDEIAKELGVKATSVRHTVSRARASLKKILSEYVIDETNGLTALDLLANSYRKTANAVQKSARVSLSILALFVAYLGFTDIAGQSTSNSSRPTLNHVTKSMEGRVEILAKEDLLKNTPASQLTPLKNNEKDATSTNVKATPLNFPGLDNDGVPSGFTITDSTGKLGSLYFNGKEATFSDDGIYASSVMKTSSGAANLFVNQTVFQDVNGITFQPAISYGRQGNWVPLNSTVISTDIERLNSGDYLLSAVVQVKSEVVSSIQISAYAGGRDLDSFPVRVLFRVQLNSTKTQIVGEAIQVVERMSK